MLHSFALFMFSKDQTRTENTYIKEAQYIEKDAK